MEKFKRDNLVTDTLKIGKEKVHIKIDPFKVMREFSAKYNVLAEAEKAATAAVGLDSPDEAFEAYGNAIFGIMDLCFGEEVRKKIVRFYDSNYVEMTQMVIPYITGKLLDKITKALASQKALLTKKYGNA